MSNLTSITIKNRTSGKPTAVMLDTSKTLAETRTTLGTLIKAEELFTSSGGAIIPTALEDSTTLSTIVRASNTIEITNAVKEGEGRVNEDPINLEPFMPTLEPVVAPDIEWASDQVGIVDGLDGGKLVRNDNVTELKVGQQRKLLKQNHIYLNRANRGVASGFIVQDNLEWAKYDAVEFTQVGIRSENVVRDDFISINHNELESRLQRQTMSESKVGGGIPLIFKVEGSYQHSSTTSTATREVRTFMQASQVIPKARVTFRDSSISMSDEFTAAVTGALAGAGTNKSQAERLIDVLESYGEFVATDIMLGGRLTFSSDTRLDEKQSYDSVKDGFKLAAGARFDLEGVPADIDGGNSTLIGREERERIVAQAKTLKMNVVGGHPSAASSKMGTLGTAWIPTLAKYLNWGVIGFHAQSLVPTIAFLNSDLRSKCTRTLKTYFTSQLQTRDTEIVGSQGDERFGPPAHARRIVKLAVNHGINIDGLQVTYELESGERQTTAWVGRRHGERDDAFELAFDEEISSIEVGHINDTSHRLAFNTTKGNRYPSAGFYGRAEVKATKTIAAPRVFGIVGASSALVHGIGLKYRVPSDTMKGRNFLLALEPSLFPTNVPYDLDLSTRGVLLAGEWRSEQDLLSMSPDEKRNTLIVALASNSSRPVEHFQGFPQNDDNRALVERGAALVFLLRSGLRDHAWLKAHSDDDHVNSVIGFIHGHTDEPLPKLQALSIAELVRWAWTIKGGAAGAVGQAAQAMTV